MREAVPDITEVLEISQRLGNPVKVGITLEMLGTVHERQGQYADTLEVRAGVGVADRAGYAEGANINRRHIARMRAKLGGG